MKGPSFLKDIKNVDYDKPGEAGKVHPWWTNIMFNNSGLPQKKRVYRVKRDGFEFRILKRPE